MRNTTKIFFLAVITGLLILRPTSSYADDHHHDSGHNHDGGHHEHHEHSYVGINFSVWPNNYYDAGPYYPSDEVLVSPAVYQPIILNGTTYYLNNGVYYIYNGYAYQAVVPPTTVIEPTTVVEPPPVITQMAPATNIVSTVASRGDELDSITINIPNDKGGYTAVTLKKSGNGYIGPQGEFYPDFPKVSQLKVVYGK